jgi:hypothetical protein
MSPDARLIYTTVNRVGKILLAIEIASTLITDNTNQYSNVLRVKLFEEWSGLRSLRFNLYAFKTLKLECVVFRGPQYIDYPLTCTLSLLIAINFQGVRRINSTQTGGLVKPILQLTMPNLHLSSTPSGYLQ